MSPSLAPPILSCAEAGLLEARRFGGDETLEWAAMEEAGRGLAAAVLGDFEEIGSFPEEGRLLVLVGKGHNGGDALIAAQEILRRHARARAVVGFLFGERSLRPLAQRAWRELAQAAGERVSCAGTESWAGAGAAYEVSLDGVFGYQYRPPLPPAVAAALGRANALPVRLRAAVDLPSGLDEPGAFRADFTYATGLVKEPLLGCAAAGRVRLIDLGFFSGAQGEGPAAGRRRAGAAPSDRVLTAALLAPLGALRPGQTDKRSYGHLLILGGSRQYPGAVLMNALAALHSGAGLVTALVPQSLAAGFAARAPEAMWVGCPETASGGLALGALAQFKERSERASALALGSGLGREPETLALAREAVRLSRTPVLIDGDALQPDIVAAARTRLVLTPHAGEYRRIAGAAELRAYCARAGATVALKGPVTRVCSGSTDQGRRSAVAAACVYHSFFGGPVLARGGSGDLLAGLTGGQLAQAAARGEPILEAVCRGVVWHGLSADALARARGQTAVSVTELIDYLPKTLRAAAAIIRSGS
jgi:NAD(P)H-hydrate epimerase